MNTATSVSNLESEYLEEENGTAKNAKSASQVTAERLKAAGLETASNKRMRSANINAWTLRYNDESFESKVRLNGINMDSARMPFSHMFGCSLLL